MRQLGRSGPLIPPIVFGATSLGNLFRVVPDDEKRRIVEHWTQCGLAPIVIDSAGKYGAGLSLEVIGRVLNELQVPKDQVIISNKLGWRRTPLTTPEPTFEPGAWFGLKHDAVQDISYDGIRRCWEDGNKLLGNFPAQLVSVHDPDEYLAAATSDIDRSERLEDLLAAYRALVELKEAGEVLAVGVGAKDWKTIQELSTYCSFDWVMFANSFTIMHHPPELVSFIEELSARGTGIINSALFHGGFLLGGDFFDYRRVDPRDPQDTLRLDWRRRFDTLCAEHEVTPFEVGVAFGFAHPAITAVALSSSRASRIDSHLRALKAEIPIELWDALKSAGLVRRDCSFV